MPTNAFCESAGSLNDAELRRQLNCLKVQSALLGASRRNSASLTLPSFVVVLVVDAENALFADPPVALRGNEFPDSVLSDVFQIFDLAHAVSGAVTLVEVAEPVAGEFGAMATESARSFITDAEAAVDTGFGLVLLGVVAPFAGILFPQVGLADAAIHPARGNEALSNRGSHSNPPVFV